MQRIIPSLFFLIILGLVSSSSADEGFGKGSQLPNYLRLHAGLSRFSKVPADAARYGYHFSLAYEWSVTEILAIVLDGELSVHGGKASSTNSNGDRLLMPSNKLFLTARWPGLHAWVPSVAIGGGWVDVRIGSQDRFSGVWSAGGGISYFPSMHRLLGSYGMKLGLEGYYSRLVSNDFDAKSSILAILVFAGSF